MWADIHTKPLQGAKFAKFRQIILNLQGDQGIKAQIGGQNNETAVWPQECVGGIRNNETPDARNNETHGETCVLYELKSAQKGEVKRSQRRKTWRSQYGLDGS
jgi:hypothetical protein